MNDVREERRKRECETKRRRRRRGKKRLTNDVEIAKTSRKSRAAREILLDGWRSISGRGGRVVREMPRRDTGGGAGRGDGNDNDRDGSCDNGDNCDNGGVVSGDDGD